MWVGEQVETAAYQRVRRFASSSDLLPAPGVQLVGVVACAANKRQVAIGGAGAGGVVNSRADCSLD
jgi:hypothetical protein